MLLLHGPNTVASRERLLAEIGRFGGEAVRLNGALLTLADLRQALESASLFQTDRLVVIEGLFSRRPSHAKDTLLAFLKNRQPDNLIIWEGKKIDGRILSPFKAKTVLFDLTSAVFKFVESLVPGNGTNKLHLFNGALVKDPPEMVFAMIARQIRLLLTVSEPPVGGLKLAPWQISRLKAQAARFSLPQLKNLHRQLLEIDTGQKTGRSPFGLRAALELWLVSF